MIKKIANCRIHLGPFSAILLATTFLAPISAMAQTTAEPASSQATSSETATSTQNLGSQPSGNVEEVVVTARRRNERAIDVPVSITSLSGAQLAEYGTTTFANLSSQIPQVLISPSMGASTGAAVTIRGFGSNTAADSSIEQAVSFNLDGVSISRGRIVTNSLFDLDDVQVLKGPQALFFGKNSPAGVIVVNSRGPTDEIEGYFRASYEFAAEETKFEGAVGGPINDKFGFRVALYKEDMFAGYVKNIAGPIAAASSPVAFDRINNINLPGAPYEWGPGSHQVAARLTAKATPTDNLDTTLKITVSDYRDNGDSSTQVNLHCPVSAPSSIEQTDLGAIVFTGAPAIVVDPYGSCPRSRNQVVGGLPPAITDHLPGWSGGSPFLHTFSALGSETVNYNLDYITLTSITGYYLENSQNALGADNTSFTLIPSSYQEHAETISEELRATSKFGGPLNFTVGFYYEHKILDTPFISTIPLASDPIHHDHNYSAAGAEYSSGDTFSPFVDGRWNILSDLELDAGARYTYEMQAGTLGNSYVQPGLVQALNLTLPAGVKVTSSERAYNLSPQATLTYHVTPDVSVYAGYRTGFKSGGISHPGLIPSTANAENVKFGDERVEGGEAGVKFRVLDSRLSGDMAVYDYRYRGLQVSAFNTNTNTVYIQNAGGAETTGVEGDLNYRATDELAVHASFGYNRAHYTSFSSAACWAGQTAAQGCINQAQDLRSEPLPRAPLWSASAGFMYDRPLTDKFAFEATIDGQFSGGYFLTPQDSPYARQAGYATLDASVRLQSIDNQWDLALIGRNLTNAYYAVVASDKPLAVAPGSIYGQLGFPRTVTLQVTYKF